MTSRHENSLPLERECKVGVLAMKSVLLLDLVVGPVGGLISGLMGGRAVDGISMPSTIRTLALLLLILCFTISGSRSL